MLAGTFGPLSPTEIPFLAAGCVCVCPRLGRVCVCVCVCVGKEALAGRLYGAFQRSVKGGACLSLTEPALTPGSPQLGLNGVPVCVCMSQLPVRKLFQLASALETQFSCVFRRNNGLDYEFGHQTDLFLECRRADAYRTFTAQGPAASAGERCALFGTLTFSSRTAEGL